MDKGSKTSQPSVDLEKFVLGQGGIQGNSRDASICVFREDEGLTLILSRECADANNISYSSVFRMITLSVHSSWDAVRFLATITSRLAMHGISVNPISAYYHDHLFIPASRVRETMELLQALSGE